MMALDIAALAAVPLIPEKAIVFDTSRAKPCAQGGIIGSPLGEVNSAAIVFICHKTDVLASTKSLPSRVSLSERSFPATVLVSIIVEILMLA